MKTLHLIALFSFLGMAVISGCSSSSGPSQPPVVVVTPSFWGPNTAFPTGSVINFVVSGQVFHATAITGGKTGATQPVIPVNGTAKDGTVVWQYSGAGAA